VNKTAKSAIASAKERSEIATLRELVRKQADQIDRMRSAKFKLSIGKKKNKVNGNFCRLIIPDTHGSLCDQAAISAMLADIEIIKPAEVIWLGDHLECGGFLAQHHTLGYVAQTEYTFENDVAATNQLIDAVMSRCNATHTYIEGNHERRIEAWIVTQVQKCRGDGNFLRKMFSADSVLGIEKRGMRWIRQGVFYDGISIPGTIRHGNCYYTHGSYTSAHAASQHVRRFGSNIVHGHTHRADSYLIRTVRAGTIGGWCPACLCQLQPLWQHTNPTDWTLGYGLQLVHDGEDFLHINVPIVNDRSLLEPFVEAMR
jgi:predicted phosphodiesterase